MTSVTAYDSNTKCARLDSLRVYYVPVMHDGHSVCIAEPTKLQRCSALLHNNLLYTIVSSHIHTALLQPNCCKL
jgi:hypothetical protein